VEQQLIRTEGASYLVENEEEVSPAKLNGEMAVQSDSRLYSRFQLDGCDKLNEKELLALGFALNPDHADSLLPNAEKLHRLIGEGDRKYSSQLFRRHLSIDDFQVNKALALIEYGYRLRRAATRQLTDEASIPEDAFEYLQELFEGCKTERFAVLYMTVQNLIISREVINQGTESESLVSISQLYRQALMKGAKRVIVAHNHPSGLLEPSEADIKVTKKIEDAGKLLDIELLDHLIVSGNRFISLSRLGYL
jgi:DNA repair protein RadC